MDKPQAAEETKEPSRGRDTQNPAEAQKKDEKKKRTFVAPEPRERGGGAKGGGGEAPARAAGRHEGPVPYAGIMRMQRLAGNAAVSRLLAPPTTDSGADRPPAFDTMVGPGSVPGEPVTRTPLVARSGAVVSDGSGGAGAAGAAGGGTGGNRPDVLLRATPQYDLLTMQRAIGNTALCDLLRREALRIDHDVTDRPDIVRRPIVRRSTPPVATANGQPTNTRHARGYGGEQGMGFGYRQELDWIFIEGPSGSAGHGITAHGFDGVAYNTSADELHLIDNKSLQAETVSSATAITKNLVKNLDVLIGKVEGMKDMPSRMRILGLLKKMRFSVATGKPIPSNTKLIVTGVGGQSTGVTDTLDTLGVEFRPPGATDASLKPLQPAAPAGQGTTPAEPGAPVPGESSPRGTTGEAAKPAVEAPTEVGPTAEAEPGIAGGLLGFALPLIAGFVHQRAVEKRIEEKAHKEGYVPRGAPSGEGFLYDLGAWFLDPGNDADKNVSLDKRFDFPVWRRHIREVANAARVGETLHMQWDIGACGTDMTGNQQVEPRLVTYRKQADGKWTVESGDAAGTPSLDAIISSSVSDQAIKSIVFADPCKI